ncbi:MAG TPA: NFACT RNA binding domain-containing protein [Candidatus Cloacimonadota bacterium]|nr:NFACT RNA binding domain-containing protein [Candidatus Cloacimonadota bacterium]HQB41537.1 NFACT RNA binding domain-containing protein [Candidatus Cloacimonadota bacterium]
MQYKYLKKWVLENKQEGLVFRRFAKYEDQYLLLFRNIDRALQISFSSAEQFLFFNKDYQLLDYEELSETSLIQTHLKHSKLKDIVIEQNDRIIYLYFERFNIYNAIETIVLVLEIMPRYSNYILCKLVNDKLMIVDCLKKISFAENLTRQILPGLEYKKPTTSYLVEQDNPEYPLFISKNSISNTINEKPYYEMNILFQDLYFEHLLKHKLDTLKKHELNKIVKLIKKKEEKLRKLESELYSEEIAFEFKKKAELLLAFQSQVPKNTDKVALNDYYQPDNPLIEVALDKKLSIKQNIALYFKRYKKAQSGRERVAEQIAKTQTEIAILKNELEEVGAISNYNQLQNKENIETIKDQSKSMFRKLPINDEWEILVGRSNTENDLLTCKTAKPDDWWFHTRVFKGTHVVLRNYKKQDLPENLLFLCAKIAAWYSKAKTSINVPIDYTQIRYVSKPKGSPKGYVIYTNQKTIYVNPIPFREAVELVKRGVY